MCLEVKNLKRFVNAFIGLYWVKLTQKRGLFQFLEENYGFLNSYLVGVISDCWSKDNKLEALWICLHDFKIMFQKTTICG